MADVFISYSRSDLEFVRRLAEGLEEKGQDVWVDLNDIMPSAPWMAEISVAIAEANAVVFVVSPDSVASRVCTEELRRAVELHKRLVPVLAKPTPIEDVPAPLAALNFVDFSTSSRGSESEDSSLERALERLVEALRTDIDAVHLHTRLLLLASEWEENGNDPGRLLRGKRLAEAERWLAADGQGGPAPAPAQVRLVLASRRAAVRRQRGSTAAALAVALGMVGLSAFAISQWRAAVVQRGQAESRAYAAQALNQVSLDPPKALDLALKAYETAPTDDAQTALREAVKVSVLRAVLPPMPQAEYASAHSGDGGTGGGEVSVSPGGDLVAVANYSGGAEVWRWRSQNGPGSYSRPYRLVMKGALQAAFGPGARSLLLADAGGSVLDWDWGSRRRASIVLAGLEGPVLSADGALVASYSSSFSARSVKIFSTATGKLVTAVHTLAQTNGATFSPDGSLLATWATDSKGPVYLWSTATGHLFAKVGRSPSLLSNTGNVPVAISPDDTRIAVSGGASNSISVYSLTKPSSRPETLSLTGPPNAPSDAGGSYAAGSLAWGPGGDELAEGGFDQALRVWAAGSGGEIFVGPGGDGAGGVAFSPDGQYLVSADNVGSTFVWQWAAASESTLNFGSYYPSGEAISPNGSVVASAVQGTRATVVWLWDWHTSAIVRLTSFKSSFLSTPDMAFSPNGLWLALVEPSGISIWDAQGKRQLARLALPGNIASLTDLRFSPSGKVLGFYYDLEGKSFSHLSARLVSWRWATAGAAATLAGLRDTNFPGNIALTRVADDGSLYFVYGRGYMSWDAKPPRKAVTLRLDAVPKGAVLPVAAPLDGGREIVVAVGNKTLLVDLASGASEGVLSGYIMNESFATNPAGNLVAGTTQNGTVVIWDAKPADVPATYPTASPATSVMLANNDMLLYSRDVLAVAPDGFASPLPRLVHLAKSLLPRPSGLAASATYAQA